MPLSIKNPRAEALARKVAEATGGSLTQAIIVSLEEHLERLKGARTAPGLLDEILAISKRCSSLPDLDSRAPDEILGYNEKGLFAGGD